MHIYRFSPVSSGSFHSDKHFFLFFFESEKEKFERTQQRRPKITLDFLSKEATQRAYPLRTGAVRNSIPHFVTITDTTHTTKLRRTERILPTAIGQKFLVSESTPKEQDQKEDQWERVEWLSLVTPHSFLTHLTLQPNKEHVMDMSAPVTHVLSLYQTTWWERGPEFHQQIKAHPVGRASLKSLTPLLVLTDSAEPHPPELKSLIPSHHPKVEVGPSNARKPCQRTSLPRKASWSMAISVAFFILSTQLLRSYLSTASTFRVPLIYFLCWRRALFSATFDFPPRVASILTLSISNEYDDSPCFLCLLLHLLVQPKQLIIFTTNFYFLISKAILSRFFLVKDDHLLLFWAFFHTVLVKLESGRMDELEDSDVMHPLPPELVTFKPLPEHDPALRVDIEAAKRAAFPWEQIDRFWVLQQMHYKMQHSLDLKVKEIRYGKSDPLSVACLYTLKVDGAETKAMLSRSFSCPDVAQARQIVASQALLLLTPHYASNILREGIPSRPLFSRPIDTRDNVFDMSGHTFMEQAMELLTAAQQTDARQDIVRYVSGEVDRMRYDSQDKTLTKEFERLQEIKRHGADSTDFCTFTWELWNPDSAETEKSSNSVEEAVHYSFHFLVYQKGMAEPLVSIVSECEGEPVTRVLYRGLLSAAEKLHCGSMMQTMWREFAVTLSPPDCASPHNFMLFYFEAFFGTHFTDPHLEVIPPSALGFENQMISSKRRSVLKLRLEHCGGFAQFSGRDCKNPSLLAKDDPASTTLMSGSECFSFVLAEVAEYLAQFPNGRSQSESHNNALRKAYQYMRTAGRTFQGTWSLKDSLATPYYRPGASRSSPKPFSEPMPPHADESFAAKAPIGEEPGEPEVDVCLPLEDDSLLRHGGLSRTSRVCARVIQQLFDDDYEVHFRCAASERTSNFMCVSSVRVVERGERTDRATTRREVFVMESCRPTVETSFMRVMAKALVLAASYRRMLAELPYLIAAEEHIRANALQRVVQHEKLEISNGTSLSFCFVGPEPLFIIIDSLFSVTACPFVCVLQHTLAQSGVFLDFFNRYLYSHIHLLLRISIIFIIIIITTLIDDIMRDEGERKYDYILIPLPPISSAVCWRTDGLLYLCILVLDLFQRLNLFLEGKDPPLIPSEHS
eukprot:gene12104-8328_t